MAELKALVSIVEAAALRPGDRLILSVGEAVTSSAGLHELRQQLRERLPDVDVVLLAGIDMMVVQPRNQADDAWAELGRLRAQAIELGITVDLSWPILRLREEIVKAGAQ